MEQTKFESIGGVGNKDSLDNIRGVQVDDKYPFQGNSSDLKGADLTSDEYSDTIDKYLADVKSDKNKKPTQAPDLLVDTTVTTKEADPYMKKLATKMAGKKGDKSAIDKYEKSAGEGLDDFKKVEKSHRQIKADALKRQIEGQQDKFDYMDESADKYKVAYDAYKDKMDTKFAEWDKAQILPLRFLAKQSMGAHIASSANQFMAIYRGDNAMLSRLQGSFDKMVDADIRAQEQEIAQKGASAKNMMSMMKFLFPDDPAARKAQALEVFNKGLLLELEMQKQTHPDLESMKTIINAQEKIRAKVADLRMKLQEIGDTKFAKLYKGTERTVVRKIKQNLDKEGRPVAGKVEPKKRYLGVRTAEQEKDISEGLSGAKLVEDMSPELFSDGKWDIGNWVDNISNRLGGPTALKTYLNESTLVKLAQIKGNASESDRKLVDEIVSGGKVSTKEHLRLFSKLTLRAIRNQLVTKLRGKTEKGSRKLSLDEVKQLKRIDRAVKRLEKDYQDGEKKTPQKKVKRQIVRAGLKNKLSAKLAEKRKRRYA